MLIPRLVVAAVAVAIAATPGAAQPPVEEVRLVAVAGDEQQPFAFEPPALTIPAGTTVRWLNTLDVFHTVTFSDARDRRVANGTFDQSLASRGDTAQRTFDAPGTYFYFCQPHSAFMAATITVTPQEKDHSRSPVLLTVGLLTVFGVVALGVLAWRRRRAVS